MFTLYLYDPHIFFCKYIYICSEKILIEPIDFVYVAIACLSINYNGKNGINLTHFLYLFYLW